MSRVRFYVSGLLLWLLATCSQTIYRAVTSDGADPLWLVLTLGLSIGFWALFDHCTTSRRSRAAS